MGTLRLSVGESHTCSWTRKSLCRHQHKAKAAGWNPVLAVARKAQARGITVPPPPNYSTPAAITARCREAGGWMPRVGGDVINHWLRKSWAAEKDRTVAKAYRAFLAACGDWRDPTPATPHQRAVGRRWGAKRRAKVAEEQRAWKVLAPRHGGAQARDLGESEP